MSDPEIRAEVLGRLPIGASVRTESMSELRESLGLDCSLGKLRRAVSSLYYEHNKIVLGRPLLEGSDQRGWDVTRLA